MNGSTRFAVAADHIFDGRTKHENAAVVIERSLIISLVPRSELTMDLSIHSLPEGFWLAPDSSIYRLMAAEMSFLMSSPRQRPLPKW